MQLVTAGQFLHEANTSVVPGDCLRYVEAKMSSWASRKSGGTSREDDRIQRRREKVRNNVRALRERRKEAAKSSQGNDFDTFGVNSNCRNNGNPSSLILKHGSNQIHLGCALLESNVSWKLNLPYRLSAGSSTQDAYIAAFRHHCSASQSASDVVREGVYISIGCGPWIQSICMHANRYDTSLISQALSASGLATLGAIRRDAGMLSTAQSAQNDILRELRHLIDEYKEPSDRKRFHFTSIVLFTCAITDLLVNKTWTTFSFHLEGVGALIEFAGPQALSSVDAFEIYQGYRSIQITFLFVERKASFLSQPQWRNVPAPSKLSLYKIQIGQLFDIMHQIPELMQMIDTKSSGLFGDENIRDDLYQDLMWIAEISESLDSWENACNFWRSTANSDRPKLSFDKPWQEETVFSSDEACTLWTYSCGARTALYELALTYLKNLSQKSGHSSPGYIALTYEWAVRGCQCLNYISRMQSNTAGKLYALFCLDMTWRALDTLYEDYSLPCAEELRWCESLATELGSTGLPILRVHTRLDSPTLM